MTHSPRMLAKFLRELSPLLVVLGVYAVWYAITPTPFSYKGDMYILAMPMTRFISLSWLSGHIPVISWLMGDGFNPWLAGQSGVLYPIYPVAMLFAKMFRREYLVLEFTAIFDFILIAYFIYGSPLFRKSTFMIRLSLALLFIVQPAAVILGQNWCYFLNSYTWCLIAMGNLLAWHRWPSKTRYAWWTLGSLLVLFTAINAQMFPFFMALCVLPVLATARPRQWRQMASMASLLGLLLIPPFLCIWWASQNGNPAWMAGRDSADAALAFGQSLPTVLKGAVLGNLAGNGFHIWRGVSSWVSGIFFVAPAGLLGLALARPKDRRLWLITGGFLLLLMGISTLPVLKWLFIGPFARFRWTWKFAVFIPAVLLGCIAAGRPERRPRVWLAFILVSAGLSFWVASRGLLVDFFPSQIPIRQLGVHGLLDPANELKARLALKPGERLVPIGRMSGMDLPVPMAWLAMIGNAPSLVDTPSLALYDPLEPASSAQFRGALSTPWREAIPDNLDATRFGRVDQYLGPQGAAVYLFKERPRFEVPANEEIHLSNGDSLWAVRSRHWQPWAYLDSGRTAPGPTIWGDWPVPEGERIRLATARPLTSFPDPGPIPDARMAMRANPGGFTGPWVLRFHPLGDLGPWVHLWYLAATLLFLGLWWHRHPAIAAMGIPSPQHLASLMERLPWRNLALALAGVFLLLRLPLLLGPQPISDAIIAYPKQVMIMVQQHLVPYGQMPFEYPPLALVPLGLAALGSGGSVWLFRLALAFQMFLLDAALLAGVVHATRRFALDANPRRATTISLGAGALYLVATQPLGCLLYDRLDVAVAAFMALPLLFRFSSGRARPWLLGAVLACGFWFKLVPILALLPLALWEWRSGAHAPSRKNLLGLFSGSTLAGAALGLAALGLFGPSLWGFLRYHLARPIEIGSIWASLDFLLSVGALHPVFEYGGWHLHTPWLDLWKILSTGLTLAGLATTVLLSLRALRQGAPPVRACSLAAVGSVLCFITFGKVFSPQFLIWFTPLLPMMFWEGDPPRRLIWVMGGCLGAISVTGIYFPAWHYALVAGDTAIWLMVILRNGLCLAALIGLWKHLFRPEHAPSRPQECPIASAQE